MWCTKITAVLLEQCMSGHCDAWGHWVSWICLFGGVFFATSAWDVDGTGLGCLDLLGGAWWIFELKKLR
jgi:hypothetical protein